MLQVFWLVELCLPEESLSVLDTIDGKFTNDNSILLAKGNAHLLLKEFEKAGEFYQMVLTKNPDSKSAQNNMIILAKHLNDHEMSGTFQQKLLGENPTPRQLDPQMGNMPYTLPINDSKNYSATVQIQIRNQSNQLIAVVESEKILYIPHPFMFKIYDHPSLLVETTENEKDEINVPEYIVNVTKFSTSTRQSIEYSKIIYDMFVRRELIKISEQTIDNLSLIHI